MPRPAGYPMTDEEEYQARLLWEMPGDDPETVARRARASLRVTDPAMAGGFLQTNSETENEAAARRDSDEGKAQWLRLTRWHRAENQVKERERAAWIRKHVPEWVRREDARPEVPGFNTSRYTADPPLGDRASRERFIDGNPPERSGEQRNFMHMEYNPDTTGMMLMLERMGWPFLPSQKL